MTYFELIKKQIISASNSLELLGLLDGYKAVAIIWCKNHCPEELYGTNGHKEITIEGMKRFLESEA